jgi:hypothetical protein
MQDTVFEEFGMEWELGGDWRTGRGSVFFMIKQARLPGARRTAAAESRSLSSRLLPHAHRHVELAGAVRLVVLDLVDISSVRAVG